MSFIDDREIRDVVREAENPGKLQKRVLVAERKRGFQKAAKMLADSRSTLNDYIDAIREIEPQEDSPEFVRAVELWHKCRGKA